MKHQSPPGRVSWRGGPSLGENFDQAMAHALVFGASGLLGGAVVDQILRGYPVKGDYAKVTALTNRPLSREDSQWLPAGEGVPELNLVSGIDLTHGTEGELQRRLEDEVPDIRTVTQVFWFGAQPPFLIHVSRGN
jgi:hypothetical protein